MKKATTIRTQSGAIPYNKSTHVPRPVPAGHGSRVRKEISASHRPRPPLERH